MRSISTVTLQLNGTNVLNCKHVITKQPTLDSSVTTSSDEQLSSGKLCHCLSEMLQLSY